MKRFTNIFKIIISIFFVGLLVGTKSAIAQTVKPIESGKIEFEHKQNMYKILNVLYGNSDIEYYKNYVEEYKSKNPQFITTQFSLTFNTQKAFYQPMPSQALATGFVSTCAFTNIVISDLVSRISQSQKNILATDFVITDSLPKIKWRITNETREIAGFNCRRANALILDSVYVVAFYTDEIVPKAGPESFTGLPGMILGVALPNEQISWFANKYTPITDNSFKDLPTLKGKKITKTDLKNLLKNNDMLQFDPKQAALLLKRTMF